MKIVRRTVFGAPTSEHLKEERTAKVRARLAASVNGYVCIRRVGQLDRSVLATLIERGEAEIFESPLGRAYRLT